MASARKFTTRIKMPKAKVSGMSLFPRAPTSTKSSKKSALKDDPKFGLFGYDLNQLSPFDALRGFRRKV